MKALPKPRQRGPRDEVVVLPEHGEHVLRAPTFTGAAIALEIHTAVAPRALPGTDQWHRELSPIYGAIAGLCWWHADFELEAQRPPIGAPLDGWISYGDAVCGELIEQGYTVHDLAALYEGAFGLVDRVHRILAGAQERADFTQGAGDEQAPPPPTP